MEDRLKSSVQIVVISYHGVRWLANCFETLRNGLPAAAQVTLVDNGGENGLDNLALDGLPCTVLETPKPMGFAEANNFALQQVGLESDAVCFLNQDTRSAPGWLEACINCLRQDSTIGAVSPLLKTYDWNGWDPGFIACAGKSVEFKEFERTGSCLTNFIEIPEVTAAAMVVRTEVLRKVGPFDPIYGSYYEDYDLCLRIRDAGYRVGICSSAKVAHYSGSATTTLQAERKRMRQIIRNRAILGIRSSGQKRFSAMIHQFFPRFTWNLCRGIFRTASSQPPSVQVAAHWDLLGCAGRLVSERRDRAEWHAYLRNLGWPQTN